MSVPTELPSSRNVFNPNVKPSVVSDEKSDAANSAQRQTNYVRPTKDVRLKRYLSNAFGVPALLSAGIGATFNQIGNNPPEWNKNVGGFGKRYASSYGTNAIQYTVTYGLSEAFRLDNVYEKSTSKSFGKRLQHAFVASYTTRTKTGKRLPDFPYFIGNYSANIIANEVWYPKRYGFQDGVRDGTYSLGARFGVNLVREFFLKK